MPGMDSISSFSRSRISPSNIYIYMYVFLYIYMCVCSLASPLSESSENVSSVFPLRMRLYMRLLLLRCSWTLLDCTEIKLSSRKLAYYLLHSDNRQARYLLSSPSLQPHPPTLPWLFVLSPAATFVLFNE